MKGYAGLVLGKKFGRTLHNGTVVGRVPFA
jgi:hypothetical protein